MAAAAAPENAGLDFIRCAAYNPALSMNSALKTGLGWLALTAAIAPVTFVVSCIGTMAFLDQHRQDVRGKPLPTGMVIAAWSTSPAKEEERAVRLRSGKFAYLLRGYALDGLKANHPDLSFYFTPDEATEFSRILHPFEAAGEAGEQTFGFEVEPFAPQQEHVHYHQSNIETELESWYDCSPTAVQGQFYRYRGDFGYGMAGVAA